MFEQEVPKSMTVQSKCSYVSRDELWKWWPWRLDSMVWMRITLITGMTGAKNVKETLEIGLEREWRMPKHQVCSFYALYFAGTYHYDRRLHRYRHLLETWCEAGATQSSNDVCSTLHTWISCRSRQQSLRMWKLCCSTSICHRPLPSTNTSREMIGLRMMLTSMNSTVMGTTESVSPLWKFSIGCVFLLCKSVKNVDGGGRGIFILLRVDFVVIFPIWYDFDANFLSRRTLLNEGLVMWKTTGTKVRFSFILDINFRFNWVILDLTG